MSTYKELVYMVLDEVKGISDDFTFTEDHVIFLLSKYRALLLYQKYSSLKKPIPESNYQTICLNMQEDDSSSSVCEFGPILKSTEKIPHLVKLGNPKVFPLNYYLGCNIVFISKDRMQYVGYNKYMTNIIYASIDPDGYLYLKSNNPQAGYIENIKVSGVFEDPQKGAELQCDNNEENSSCDILDKNFPIEESLIPDLIQSVVKELTGAVYRPKDSVNNSSDDLSPTTKSVTNQNIQR